MDTADLFWSHVDSVRRKKQLSAEQIINKTNSLGQRGSKNPAKPSSIQSCNKYVVHVATSWSTGTSGGAGILCFTSGSAASLLTQVLMLAGGHLEKLESSRRTAWALKEQWSRAQ